MGKYRRFYVFSKSTLNIFGQTCDTHDGEKYLASNLKDIFRSQLRDFEPSKTKEANEMKRK